MYDVFMTQSLHIHDTFMTHLDTVAFAETEISIFISLSVMLGFSKFDAKINHVIVTSNEEGYEPKLFNFLICLGPLVVFHFLVQKLTYF